MVEKILNNTTPYGKIRASHEGSLHSSTLSLFVPPTARLLFLLYQLSREKKNACSQRVDSLTCHIISITVVSAK